MTPAEVTARIVASHAAIGQVSRRRAMPREQPPDFIESEYATRLVAEVRQWREAIDPLLADLPSLLTSARADDTNEGRRARGVIEHGRMIVLQSMVDVRSLAPKVGRSVADQQRGQLDRQLKAALGVAIITADRKVPTQIDHFIAQNVAKIRSLGDRTMDDVERLVADAFTSRMPFEELSRLIAKRFAVAESFARRIAADQITKLNAQIAQARHQELGVVTFLWKTMGDGLVRDSHAVKNKRVYPYRGPLAPSFLPGEEPGCRCRAVPIFDGIRIAAGIDRPRRAA